MTFNYNSLIKGELDSHQVEGVQYALTHHYHLNCFEMGLGKTLCALTVAFFHQRNKHFPVLVVVPSYLSFNWVREINKFARAPKDIWTPRTGKKVWECIGNEDKPDFCIISYDLFRAHPGIMDGFKMVIADEVHYLKSIAAKVTIEFHDALDLYRPDVFIGLTGTPILNKVSEFYSTLSLCGYNPRKTSGLNVVDRYSHYHFQMELCWAEEVRISRTRSITKYVGLKNKELLDSLLEGKFIRRDSSELDLKEPKHIDVVVDYKADTALLEAWELFNKGIKQSVGIKVKKESALKTAMATAEHINTLLDADVGPIVVFTCHPDAIDIMSEKIKSSSKSIQGSTSNIQRDKIVEEFQAGKVPVLFLTLAGSTGITLTASHIMVINDEDWVPENMSQVRARINRRGQTKRCLYYYMRGSKASTIIGTKLLEKSAVIKEALDGWS